MKQLAIFDNALERWLRRTLPAADYQIVSGESGVFQAAVFPPWGAASAAVRCQLAVLPGGWQPAFSLCAQELVTYGFSLRDTLTFSSADGPLFSLQRELMTLTGQRLGPQEFKLSRPAAMSAEVLCAVASALAAGLPVEKVQALSPEF